MVTVTSACQARHGAKSFVFRAAIASQLLALCFAAMAQAQPGSPHDKAYWQAVIANDFAPPADAPLPGLLQELNGYLASPDPELRDDIAYAVLAQWIYVRRLVPTNLLRPLAAEWRANLAHGVGERGTDAVFLRSFSALMLSVAAALNNDMPWLDESGFDRLLLAALAYLRAEQDTRGFDAKKGWMHSVAHTADLLKFLGRSRHLEREDQSAILDAIADKLAQLDHVPVHGEHERLARAVLSIAARPDLDLAAFDAFLARLEPVRPGGVQAPAELAADQNRKQMAVSLYALLATEPRASESLQRAEDRVLALLKATL